MIEKEGAVLGFVKKKISSFSASIKSFGEILLFSTRMSFRASPRYFIGRVLIEGVTAVLPFVTIYVTSLIITMLSKGAVGAASLDENMDKLLLYILLLFVVAAVSKGAQKLTTYFHGLHQELIIRYSKYEVMEKSASLDLQFFDSTEFYDEIMDADRNSAMLSMTSFQLLDFVNGLIQSVIAFSCLCVLNPLLSVLLVIAVIPSVIFEKKQIDAIYFFQRENMNYDRKLFYMTELFTQREFAKDIKFYNLFPYIGHKYKMIYSELISGKRKISSKYTSILILFACVPEIITFFALFQIGKGIFGGMYTVGDFTYYQGMIGQLTASLLTVIFSVSQLSDAKIRIENYVKFMKWENKVRDDGRKKPDLSRGFTMEFKNVSFRYSADTPYILKNLSFRLDGSQKIALAGVNGSGKSTIIKLLLRFYDPTEGEILANGVNIKEYTLASWRKTFSAMFQDYNNYAFSVRESVALSNIENVEDRGAVSRAVQKSGAQEFVSSFPKGEDTYLTREYEEDGVELSGGQWQKIALARTFFRNAPYYILDEPSAALDAESEDELFRQFETLYRDKGALLVSHRLSNISSFDQILVLDNGVLVEQGTHRELMGKKGKYAHMYSLQAGKYELGMADAKGSDS